MIILFQRNIKLTLILIWLENKKFEEEINRYSYNWSSGGQFSKRKTNKFKILLTYLFVVFLILVFVLSIAVKAITQGVEAKQIIKDEKI